MSSFVKAIGVLTVAWWLATATSPVTVHAVTSRSALQAQQIALAEGWTWRDFSKEVLKGAAGGAAGGLVCGLLGTPAATLATGVGAIAGAAAGAVTYAVDWLLGVQPRVAQGETGPPPARALD
jgi:outer membrane lipoprotein SlyB